MEELDLFGPVQKESVRNTILRNRKDGIVFYSVSQSSQLLGLSSCQVRYAIENYRLDSFLLFGEYRIPFNALLSFSEDDMKGSYLEYFKAIENVALDGVHALNFEGCISRVIASLKDKDMPYESILTLTNKDKEYVYDDLPSEEKDPQDWYSIEELELPLKGTVSMYAGIIGVRYKNLAKALDRYALDEVSYGEIYDFLVEHEVVNLSIPFTVEPEVDKEDDKQLFLF